MASCISKCKDTIFNLMENQRTLGVKVLCFRSGPMRSEGEAAKDYKGGLGWDECK